MPQIIEVPGHGQVEFPDGMSDGDIATAIRRNMMIPKEPSAVDRAGRVAGLGARAVTQGVLGLPVMVGDAVNQGVNLGIKGINAVAGTDIQPRASVQDGFQSLMNNAGLPEPQTMPERFATGVTSALAGTGAQLQAARQAPGAVAEILRSVPGKQVASAATGAAAAQGVAEAGGGTAAQMAAGVAGGMVPFGPQMMRGARPLTPTEQTGADAIASGLTVPPTQVRPNLANKVLEGTAGKITTAQSASAKNQPVVNKIVVEELGLPKGTVLSQSVLEGVRSKAGMAYGRIKMLPLKFKPDNDFAKDVADLTGDYAIAAKEFPKTTGSVEIDNLQADLLAAKTISPPAAIEKIKDLRFNATKNYKSYDDPAKAALGAAQKRAANALEDLVERRLTQSGKSDLVDEFRQARTLIAKTYDAEAALNTATGNVSGRTLATISDKHPLSGGMGRVAQVAKTFPKAMQSPETMGSLPGWSPLDMYAGAGFGLGGYAAGSPELMALSLLRPTVRGGILSPQYQQMISPGAPMPRGNAAALGMLSSLYQPK
jgi:hypothetical protein